MTNDTVISVRDASIFQTDTAVLENVNFDVLKGEFAYLIGRTGSGKSSLLKTLYGDLPLRLGDAMVAGYSLRKLSRKQVPFLRRKIGIVFQDFQLLPDRTVADNLQFVMRATGWNDRSKMKKRLLDVLMRVGLGSVETKMPHQLSGGEQQRVVIARALLNEPAIILADEPTGNLDPEVAEGILRVFQEINRSGTAVLMATHNYQFVEHHKARLLKCERGHLLDSAKETVRLSNA
ncbi:cell division transport system ATP-binding protein [Catalinimonas alkaloidigena]|uniref:Cell division ATP-binding protein FtsE n=2 Tax=Catalinimonas alkaloidigena TaxID=1075417 RepID=A0A1G8WQ09_9BACT|nr:cell division transport system ATP-binding protein [Catalinimonas alkaloidigena]